jgi:hypothetical protein
MFRIVGVGVINILGQCYDQDPLAAFASLFAVSRLSASSCTCFMDTPLFP